MEKMLEIAGIGIDGLFGNRDVFIDMSKETLILVGENGLGKTTILSIVNLILQDRLHDLASFPIEGIRIHFAIQDNHDKGASYNFPVSIIKEYAEARKFILDDVEEKGLYKAEKLILDNGIEGLDINRIKELLLRNKGIVAEMGLYNRNPESVLHDFITEFPSIFHFRRALKRMNLQIVYLPTYRRIETSVEALVNSTFPSDNTSPGRYSMFRPNRTIFNEILEKSNVMHFGMGDVDRKIKSMIGRISHTTAKGFSEMSGQMISQLLAAPAENKNLSKSDTEHISIVLQRIGNSISVSDKEKIAECLKTGAINENPFLPYLLLLLVQVYRKTEGYDGALKDFCKICNAFLYDKAFHYDESKIHIGLYFNSDKSQSNAISLEKLSSGEKQMIALFATAYLEMNKRIVFLIDEPELSLSIFWQKLLLPSLVKSPNYHRLIAVTHSPFIFDNELKSFAKGTDEYVNFK